MDEINTNTPVPPVEPETNKSKFKINKWIGLVILILVLGAAAAGAFYLKNHGPKVAQVPPTPTPAQIPTPTPTDGSNTPIPDTSVLPKDTPKAPEVEKPTSGLIAWHYPTKTHLNILKHSEIADQYTPYAEFLEVGQFKSGKYQNQYLFVALLPCQGPCPVVVMRIVGDTNQPDAQKQLTVLKNYSDPLDNADSEIVDMSNVKVDSSTKIADLDIPQTLTGSNPKQKLYLAQTTGFRSNYLVFDATNLRLVFNDPQVGSVYTTPDDNQGVSYPLSTFGFYVKLPDWSFATYKFQPDFVGADNIPNVTWTDNSQNHNDYDFVQVGGCGGSNYAFVVDQKIVPLSSLQISGKTSNGDNVYEFKDPNAQMLKDMYDHDYNPYDPNTWQPDPSKKIPYNQFVASHPIFFWLDSFGRLIQFVNRKFVISAAECGKPVIYLYPTQTENVNVKLNPTGGFSYTEPNYGTGWNVLAQPNGQLINLSDNKNYPYLFWEGRSSDIYQIPNKGFVVAKSDVHNFLNEKLAKLGLNEKETADFEEYWEPYMQSAPYYFVTFMGNSVMDKIAPLQVTPKPDTVIRILMDFKPLEKPVSVQGYEIKTPERKGFTVVEWGGVK